MNTNKSKRRLPYGFKQKLVTELLTKEPDRNIYDIAAFAQCHPTHVGRIKKRMEEEGVYPDTDVLLLEESMVYTPKPEPETTNKGDTKVVSDILDRRHTQYGNFSTLSQTAVDIKVAVGRGAQTSNVGLEPDQVEALDLIATKMARIVNGNPNIVDHWRDIAGYAVLVADRLEGKIR